MLKKLIAGAAGAGLVLTMAGAALAFGWWNDELTVKNTDTTVKNYVTTKADSGDNEIHGKYVGGWFGGGAKINTGDATAVTALDNVVNYTEVEGCGCFDDVTVKNRDTMLKNMVYTKADSGDNEIHGKYVKAGKINTGTATAVATLTNMVNFTMVGATETL
jgi:hypothetical protein